MTEALPDFRPIDRSKHVLLVVDDEPASLYATVRQLRGAGFQTREASSGAAGLLAADDSISAMVLDVHLPDMDGLELCRILRSRPETNRLPVLHLTAEYVTDDDKVRGLDSGADAYLTRPVEPAVLVATVQALVRTRVAEDAMRHSEAKFRAIYAQAPSGIGLVDEQGRFIDTNPAMHGLFGLDAAALLGRTVSEFVPPEWVERVNALMAQSDAKLASSEFPVLDRAGHRVHLDWSLSRDIEPGVHMVVANNVSQRVELEEQRQLLLDRERVARGEAERLSRTKDDFIAVLSHELRTPLNAIMQWAHVLQRRGGGEELMRGLGAIERNVKVQGRMIADLLDMSRLNVGKLPMWFETVDPAEALLSAVQAMQQAFDENGHTISYQLSPPYRPIRADSARLQQVIWNLLTNAIKFSPKGSDIAIGLSQTAEGVMLRVSDQGQGMSPEFLPFAFDRFVQSHAAGNRQRGGLGLGLSIVKQLVEAHGGTITAFSAGIGQGSTFEVVLPADVPAVDIGYEDTALGDLDAGPASAHGELDAPLAGMSLLVVEDDQEAAAMLKIILTDRGARVALAHDVDSALNQLKTLQPDLLISDIGLPGRDGYDLIRELRQREITTRRHLPAIALTAFTRAQDQQQAMDAGFDAHCSKPVRPLKLIQTIQRLTQSPTAPNAR